MMQNCLSNFNRYFLVCPYRNCLLPLEDKPNQDNFKLHVISCKNLNFLSGINEVQICGLNHHFSPIHKSDHILCENIVKTDLQSQEFLNLKNNVMKWTVFPFKPKVQNFHNIIDINFDVTSTLIEGYNTARIFRNSLEISFLSLTRQKEVLSTSCQQKDKNILRKNRNIHTIKDTNKDSETHSSQDINPDYTDFIHLFEPPERTSTSILKNLLS